MTFLNKASPISVITTELTFKVAKFIVIKFPYSLRIHKVQHNILLAYTLITTFNVSFPPSKMQLALSLKAVFLFLYEMSSH